MNRGNGQVRFAACDFRTWSFKVKSFLSKEQIHRLIFFTHISTSNLSLFPFPTSFSMTMKIAAAAVFYLRLANRSPWTPWGIGLTRLDEWLEVTDFNGCLDINFKVLVGAPNSRRKLSFCEKSPVFVATEFFPNAIRFAWKFGLKRHGYMAFSPGGQRFAFSQFSQEIWIKIAWWSRCPNGPTLEVLSLALAQPEHVVVLPQGTELKQKKPGRCWWEVHSYPVGSIYHWYIWV